MNECDLFMAALPIEDPAERSAYLDRECAGEPALRQRVEALLAAFAQAGSFLQRPAADPGATSDVAQPGPSSGNGPAEGPGTVIGPYRLLEEIGEGGMGTVWMAEQTEPVKRLVAVKLIKAGMDSRQVLARFEAERQALALMDHPNIARVLDAGTSGAGRPYFVMDLVKGVPITRYCDEHRLTPRQRLELFLPVCQAVQHAHHKGIIHRDLKPSNVLVAPYDGKPVVKVIDFGVAKAAGQTLTEQTLVTGFGALVGTPEYMSPEQAQLNQLDIDTRSDVYSLGVLLYELLTGSPPFGRPGVEQGGLLEMLRVIREQEPTKPSTKLSTAEGLPALAANRGTEPAKLTRLVRGELDWIVMKALEKDRNRRYETANSFARDVQRYLADEPVLACPPSAWYRLGKFVRRNKAALAVICVIVWALVMAVVGLAVSNWLVARERDQKAQALSDREKALASEGVALGKARASELLARWRYHNAQMNLAMQAWRAGEAPRVLELLEGQRPQADEEDLRGFEWFYLWRLCNGGRRVPIQGHTTAAVSLAFSPDGRTLASASWDRTVRLWDTATGNEQKVLRGHDRGVWEVACSPDGKLLVSSGQEAESMILWDVSTGQPLRTIAGSVTGLQFTQDGKAVVGSLVNGTARDYKEWDVASGAERATIADAGNVVGLVPARKTLVTTAGEFGPRSEVRFWDTASGARRLTISVPQLQTATLSPDGTRVATSVKESVKVWDTGTGKQQSAYPTDSHARRLAFSPDGKKLAAGLHDRCVIVWDVATGKQLDQCVHLGVVSAVAFSPDGKSLASGTLGGAIKLWNMTPADEATTIPNVRATSGLNYHVRRVRFSPDGKTLVVGNRDLTKIIDVAAGKEIAVLPVSEVVALSADANVLAARANRDEYTLWDIRAGRELASISLPQLSGSSSSPRLTLSPDGKLLAGYRAWGHNTVTLWDVATQQSKTLKPAPPESNRISVLCAEFSPDGKLLAAGFQFQWVTVWDVATGTVKLQFCQQPAMMHVDSVAFSPSGKTLAVGTDVGAVTLWDVETGKRLVAFRGHTSLVRGLAFSPDGQTLATAGADKSVRLWDVVTGQERSTLTGHTGAVEAVSFSPDGYTLATTSSDGTVKLWRGATDPEALAPRRAPSVLGGATARDGIAGSLVLPPGAIELTAAGLREGVRRWPDNAELHRRLGKLLQGQGELAQAESSFQAVVRLKPDDVRAFEALAQVFRQQRKFAEAETALRELIRLKPTHVHAHDALGWTLLSQGKFPEMEATFRDLLRLKPDQAGGHHGLGRALLGQKKSGDAIAPLREAVRLGSKDHWVYDALGWALVEENQPVEAGAAFREVIRLKPDLAQGHFGLGRALLDQKKFADAETALREVLRLNPTHPWAGNLLAQALVGQGKSAEAEELKRSPDKRSRGQKRKRSQSDP
jgi:WD40 repeat protein/serine/threonine protein kinase/tetratricopeptide (TPR) repeat protein